MLRYLKLERNQSREVNIIDLSSIVYVHKMAADDLAEDVEVQIQFSGGAAVRLQGEVALEFLGQFDAYIKRLHLKPADFSGPGHSALSP
jgi:hypothetical protein